MRVATSQSTLLVAALALALSRSLPVVSARLQPPGEMPRVRLVHGARAPLWTPLQRADAAAQVAFTLALHSATSPRELDALVRSVSDVASPNYGQFLTADQLRRHYKPSEATQDAIRAFLAQHAESQHIKSESSAAGDFVTLRMPVATAEKLFQTQLFEFAHEQQDHLRVIRPHAEGFVVPPEIESHVLFIDGLESFPTPTQAQYLAQDGDPFAVKSLRDTISNSDILATPALIRKQYDVPDDLANWNATHPSNKIVVSAFLNEYYTEGDLKQFLAKYDSVQANSYTNPKHTGDCIAGVPGSLGKLATGEASLDVQVVASLARSDNLELVCFQQLRDPTREFADDNQEPFLQFMQTVNAMDPAPSVVSISYTDEECAVPAGYRDAVNREFQKAALKGISIIISAGDGGVQGSRLSAFCGIQPCSRFVAMFPASSPYVTAVGATSLVPASLRDGKYGERVTSSAHGDLITSGGGFSAVYAQPDYQKDAVQAYLDYAAKRGITNLFNTQGRAYPDIAALGHSFPVYENGKVWRTDGTSVSAPIVSSLIALLNKQRFEQGKPALGFLNPLIYSLYAVCPHVFQDIADGNIACGGRNDECCAQGHDAIPGWDAASGVGTIKLKTLASELDGCIEKIRSTPKASSAQAGAFAKTLQTISLLQQVPSSTTVIMQIEQVGLVVTLLAAVALMGVLVSMRGRVFPGRSFFEFQRNEPAREYLLAGQN